MSQTVNVVLAADDGFAMPLAVTVRSLVETLDPDRSLQIFVLDGGIRDTTKAQLVRSWPGERCRIEWIRPDSTALAGLQVSDHVNCMTYYRLLIDRVLPRSVERVIYLDADLLVRRDIGLLWVHELSGRPCGAVQDCAAPFLDASRVLTSFARCGPRLAAVRPIPNYRELGLAPESPYFNGGMLLIDLAAWRRDGLGERMLECLHRHRAHVLWWDQYALNVVLAGNWQPLDPRWNQGAHLFEYPSWQQSPYEQPVYDALRADPYIVHFSSPVKPWHGWCPHPFRKEFFACLDRTACAGWRPQRHRVVGGWCAAHWHKARKRLAILRRAVTARLRRSTQV